MHEDEVVAVIIKEAALGFLEDHPLHRLRRAEPLVQLGAVTNVAKLDLGKGAAFAGLHMFDLHRGPQAPVMFDHIAGFDGVTVQLHGVPLVA